MSELTTMPEQQPSTLEVAVCGQHMRGFVLHTQLEKLGAAFVEVTHTAPLYHLFALPTEPVKPGLVRVGAGGRAIEVEVYRLTYEAFGRLVAAIPQPLGFGTVVLADGREVEGFLAEPIAVFNMQGILQPGVEDITDIGWRNYITSARARQPVDQQL